MGYYLKLLLFSEKKEVDLVSPKKTLPGGGWGITRENVIQKLEGSKISWTFFSLGGGGHSDMGWNVVYSRGTPVLNSRWITNKKWSGKSSPCKHCELKGKRGTLIYPSLALSCEKNIFYHSILGSRCLKDRNIFETFLCKISDFYL